jgi:hypothetical protein
MSPSASLDTTAQVHSRHATAKDRLDEVAAEHPDVPRLVILKTDVQRRGVHYTESAMNLLDPNLHQVTGTHMRGSRDGQLVPRPESLLLRDGSSIITSPTPVEQDPYWVDGIDGKLWLRDGGDPIEEVEYWPRPDYYGKLTAKGVDYRYIVSARPQRLCIFPYRHCNFANDDQACLFCDMVNQTKKGSRALGIPARLDPEHVAEVVHAALKEPGRFSTMLITAGSDPRGAELFDREVDYYVEIFQAIGRNFKTPSFPSQLISTAYTHKQLERLHAETGLMSFTADLEVLDDRLFQWICPGKARWVGYAEWKRRLVDAVEVFGRGRVGTGIVAGVELAKPHGWATEEEALARNLDEAEWLAERGVTTVFIIWNPLPGTPLGDQRNASLDYYVRLAKGFHRIRRSHGLTVEYDDYRRCGNHPDSDLDRLLY